MKSVQVVDRGRAEFVRVPKPQVKPGNVVISTSHLSLCGSDIRMLHHSPDHLYPFPPGTTGHEMVGVIAEMGDDDLPLSVGDRVLALAPDHRAMCEFYLAPVDLVLPLPEGKPIEVLLQAQQLGTVLYAAQRLPNLEGKDVVIIGQGSAGLWFNFVARRSGAASVIAVDHDKNRLRLCRQFGATHVILNSTDHPSENLKLEYPASSRKPKTTQPTAMDELTEILNGKLADVVIEAAGEADSINLALQLVRKFGDILYFGYPRGQHLSIDFEKFFHQCCRATSIVGATEEPNQISSRKAIELINEDSSLAEALISHRLRFDEVLEAYEMHRTRADSCMKIVIEMPGAVE